MGILFISRFPNINKAALDKLPNCSPRTPSPLKEVNLHGKLKKAILTVRHDINVIACND